MLSHLLRRSSPQAFRRFSSNNPTRSQSSSVRRNGVFAIVACVGGLAGASIIAPSVYADVLEKGDIPNDAILKSSKYLKSPSPSGDVNDLETYTWGSNKNHTISANDLYDTRRPLPFLQISGPGTALRDLAFHETHAAAVDSSGNLYQWGDGYFGSEAQSSGGPKLTLKDKDIIKIALSASKIYALSKSGKVYVVSASSSKQCLTADSPGMNVSWWKLFCLWDENPSIDFVELHPDSKLHSSERFSAISVGRSHVLALTSSGRTFATPISSSANSHGQLGVRKVQLLSPLLNSTTRATRTPIDLLPKALQDPFAQSSPAIRTITSTSYPSQTAAPIGETRDEDDIRYCDMLFEVPALRGVSIAQIAAGDRASYAKTSTGRVLGWGANEYGQIALGSTFTMPYIPVPTEIDLFKNYPGGTSVQCLDIAAGGDMVYFTVESKKPTSASVTIDLLAAGMGQYGSLGNSGYSQSQSTPVKVKVVSGVQEYSEVTKSTQPLAPKIVSASPTHHVIVTLDTFHLDGNVHEKSKDQARKGRDVYSWGYNADYQLGLGKRANIPQPTPLPADAFVGGFDVDDKVGRMITRERHVAVLRDLQGKKVGKNAKVEQTVVAGWGCSAMYWKVV